MDQPPRRIGIKIAQVSVIACCHLLISFSIYVAFEPGAIAGSRGSKFASPVIFILCFPLILLERLDDILPDQWRLPEFLFPFAWIFSSVLWGVMIILVWNWWQKCR